MFAPKNKLDIIIIMLMFVANLLVTLAFRLVDCIAKYKCDLPGRNVVANI